MSFTSGASAFTGGLNTIGAAGAATAGELAEFEGGAAALFEEGLLLFELEEAALEEGTFGGGFGGGIAGFHADNRLSNMVLNSFGFLPSGALSSPPPFCSEFSLF